MKNAASGKAQHDYRPDIDGLRALAIIGVVVYHAGIPGISGGFVGVDVFFVISGYLITQLLAREVAQTGTVSIANFYARRARRILPALATVMLATLVVGSFVLPPGIERQQLAASAAAASVFFANHFFLGTTGGYFDGVAELKPLLHLWSLAVEEQFYLVWPLLLLAIAKFAAPARRLRWMRIATLLIGAISFLLSVWMVRKNPSAAFYVAPTRAWELGVGAMLALGIPGSLGVRVGMGRVVSLIGLAFVAAAYLLITPGTRFPGEAALLPVLGTALVIWGNDVAHPHAPARLLSAKPLVAIGKLSYGWYLWHWPVLALANSWQLMEPNSLVSITGVLVALLLAALTLRYVENPIRFGWRGATSVVLWSGSATVVLLAGLSFLVLETGPSWPKNLREQRALQIGSDHAPSEYANCLVDRANWDGELPLDACTFGDRGKPIEFIVWGDSHAMSWMPLLEAANGKDTQTTYLQLTMSGCRPLAPEVIDRYSPTCRDFRTKVMRTIDELRPRGLKGVIIAGRWPPMSHADVPVFNRPQSHPGLRDLLARLRDAGPAASDPLRDELPDAVQATFQALETTGIRVLVLLDPFELRYPLSNCIYVNYRQPERCGIDRDYYDRNFASVSRTFRAVAARFEPVRVVDPAAYLCTARGCPGVMDGGVPVLYDADHISASAARVMAPKVMGDLAWLLANERN